MSNNVLNTVMLQIFSNSSQRITSVFFAPIDLALKADSFETSLSVESGGALAYSTTTETDAALSESTVTNKLVWATNHFYYQYNNTKAREQLVITKKE